MRVRVYQAGDGDCLLLSDATGARHLLVDGGRAGTFARHTAPDLDMQSIDAVCVSHIDDDHIAGVLKLFDTEVAWRRHAFERDRGLPTRVPDLPRPPRIKEIWLNALYALLGDELEVRAQHALVTSANLLRARGEGGVAQTHENLALGERSAMALARRVSREQLRVRLNDSSNGDVLIRDTARGRRFGRMRIKVVGPSREDIAALRVRWKRWIDANPTMLDALRDALRRDEASADGTSGVAQALGDGAAGITAPNLASIILLVKEARQSVLLTGDADAAEILHGLEAIGAMDTAGPGQAQQSLSAAQRLHVSVFKIPHHGAEANVTAALAARVTADHYVFCGNGAHHNPELSVVAGLAHARFAGNGPDRPFRFWFSTGPDSAGLSPTRRSHMQAIERLLGEELVPLGAGQLLAPRFTGRRSYLDVE